MDYYTVPVIKLPKEKVEKEPAPVWKRLLAFLIDFMFFMFAIYNPFMTIYLSRIGVPLSSDINAVQELVASNPKIQNNIMIGIEAASMVFLVYFVVLEYFAGVTLGEFFIKIKVLTTKGRKANIIQLLIRNLTKTIILPFLPFDCVGYFLFRRRFTEVFSGTDIFYVPAIELIE